MSDSTLAEKSRGNQPVLVVDDGATALQEPARRVNWADDAETPPIFTVRIRCAHCGAGKYRILRSIDQGDGSTLRKCICSKCDGAFKVIVEPETYDLSPETGECD